MPNIEISPTQKNDAVLVRFVNEDGSTLSVILTPDQAQGAANMLTVAATSARHGPLSVPIGEIATTGPTKA